MASPAHPTIISIVMSKSRLHAANLVPLPIKMVKISFKTIVFRPLMQKVSCTCLTCYKSPREKVGQIFKFIKKGVENESQPGGEHFFPQFP